MRSKPRNGKKDKAGTQATPNPIQMYVPRLGGTLASEDSDEPVMPPFRLRNSKWC